MRHPLTDQFANDLYQRTPLALLPETQPFAERGWQPWELAEPALREVFRDQARRFMAGDESVLPWRFAPRRMG